MRIADRFVRRAGAFIAAVAAHAVLPAAAWAADPAQLDCILDGVSQSERTALAAVLIERRRDRDVLAPFAQAAARCRQAHDWSDDDTRNAIVFAVSAAGLSEIRRRLAARGIATTELEAAVLSDGRFMEEIGRGVETGVVTTGFAERNDALIGRLIGSMPSDREVAPLIEAFAAFRGTVEIGRRRFTAN
jgi:hypothetical protein